MLIILYNNFPTNHPRYILKPRVNRASVTSRLNLNLKNFVSIKYFPYFRNFINSEFMKYLFSVYLIIHLLYFRRMY